jgi:hypothetical protein
MPYTIPARVSKRGRQVPEIIVDDEFKGVVERRLIAVNKDGHATTDVNGKKAMLHRYLWTLKYGTCPPLLDHINTNKLDNRLSNLRPASGNLNQQNQWRRHKRGRQDLPAGVCHIPLGKSGDYSFARSKPYRAMIGINGNITRKFLGCYATPEEAGAVYQAMKFMLILVESALCA